jgi:hypothetical protein
MADVTSISQTYSNAGASIAGGVLGVNFEQLVNTQGLSGRIIIADISKTGGDATEAEIVATLKGLGNAGGDGTGTDTGGPDAFTVVGFNAATLGTDPAYVILQGTGTLNTADGAYATSMRVGNVLNIAFTLAV